MGCFEQLKTETQQPRSMACDSCKFTQMHGNSNTTTNRYDMQSISKYFFLMFKLSGIRSYISSINDQGNI